jgi:hypothetical protein
MKTAVDEKLAEVQPGTFRHEVLECARRFKTSWVELGAVLVRVRREDSWKAWGYSSFESYCSRELHIRRSTAEKLTMSYGFLARHERAVANDQKAWNQAPAFEVISVVADAEERGAMSEGDYHALREQIWSDRPAHTVAREIRDRFPPPKPASPPPDETLKRLVRATRRLADELRGCRQVPKSIADRAAALANDVQELVSDL